MSAGTVTFRSGPTLRSLLERLRDDLESHRQEYHHVTPSSLRADLDAAIAAGATGVAEALRAELNPQPVAPPAPPPRFVEVNEVVRQQQLAALILIAIDRITKVRLYSPGVTGPFWIVALDTADGPYRREFVASEAGEAAARSFVTACTRSL